MNQSHLRARSKLIVRTGGVAKLHNPDSNIGYVHPHRYHCFGGATYAAHRVAELLYGDEAGRT